MTRPLVAGRLWLLLIAALWLAAAPVLGEEILAPNAHLQVEGIPAIPAALAAKVSPYTEFRPRRATAWHPRLRQLLVVTRKTNTVQLHRVDAPGATLIPLTDYADPVRDGAFVPARPDSLLFTRDMGGNEQTQIYRLDPAAAQPELLTDPQRAHRRHGFDRARRHLLMTSVELDKTGKRENPTTDLWLLDPLNPAQVRKLDTLPGTGWGDFSFAFDDRRLAMVEGKSANESYVWMLDLATGKRTRLLPKAGEMPPQPIATSEVQFARDGKGLYLATDRDGEFQRSAYFDLASGRLTYFGPADWNTEQLALSPDGRVLAAITNEAGIGTLRLYDAQTRKELRRPTLPVGTISGAIWHENSTDLAFNINSARGPGDVWSLNVRTGEVARWTQDRVEGLDASAFQVAMPIEWTSFDDRKIGGFITRPPQSFSGKRPVIVDIHGGPEAQARPGFMGRWNYYINELGVALIEPNVRGSAGYGKTFLMLDNGMKREDSVKDIGALLDWIATQPDLDSSRVLITGGSYGGYMSLAVATHYADRIAGNIDVVGIANFVTFLENTESYRRDLRRVEYGDERDPAMRAFLSRISPVNNAARIAKPLFVAHGRNDPRVPYTEAEQIVTTARKSGVPVWYLLAGNEGHGFGHKENSDYYFCATILFAEKTLQIKTSTP